MCKTYLRISSFLFLELTIIKEYPKKNNYVLSNVVPEYDESDNLVKPFFVMKQNYFNFFLRTFIVKVSITLMMKVLRLRFTKMTVKMLNLIQQAVFFSVGL